jgi:hypothetical protein
MLKDVNGLPNDMNTIVNSLYTSFRNAELGGTDTNSIATTYLRALSKLNTAKFNLDKYKEIYN